MEKTPREPEYPIDDRILHRWSPRSFTQEPISDEQLFSLFEAAKWAPSSYNNQPWRFIYAKKNTPFWNDFLSLLIDFNKEWAQKAAALIVIISKKTFDNGNFSKTHSFDTGAAWQNLALQAGSLGFVAHGMEGFDYEKAKTKLRIPDEFQVEAMVAIGKQGPKEQLSVALQKREQPSLRRLLQQTVFEGKFT
ncbi:MAG: nitroreductase family protein [Parachlamydiales bacterium]|nr:nitroreductase family protein [Parachlamydiales bacterium]